MDACYRRMLFGSDIKTPTPLKIEAPLTVVDVSDVLEAQGLYFVQLLSRLKTHLLPTEVTHVVQHPPLKDTAFIIGSCS